MYLPSHLLDDSQLSCSVVYLIFATVAASSMKRNCKVADAPFIVRLLVRVGSVATDAVDLTCRDMISASERKADVIQIEFARRTVIKPDRS